MARRQHVVIALPLAWISSFLSLVGLLLLWLFVRARFTWELAMSLPSTILQSGILPESWIPRLNALALSASYALLRLLYRLLGLAHRENIALANQAPFGDAQAYPPAMQAVIDATTC